MRLKAQALVTRKNSRGANCAVRDALGPPLVLRRRSVLLHRRRIAPVICDMLHDILQTNAPVNHRALVRSRPRRLYDDEFDVKQLTDYLYSKRTGVHDGDHSARVPTRTVITTAACHRPSISRRQRAW
jgi:hypothetical protein